MLAIASDILLKIHHESRLYLYHLKIGQRLKIKFLIELVRKYNDESEMYIFVYVICTYTC